MRTLLGLAILPALLAGPAWAADDAQECRAFARQDLAVIMREKPGSHARFGSGEPGAFGDFAAAVAHCRGALAQAPDDAGLQLQYVRTLLAQNEFSAVVPALQPLVRAEQPTALRIYGVLLSFGLGPAEDLPKAGAMLRRAAELGDPVAPLSVGVNLLTAREPESAYGPWFARAARTGYAPAEYYASTQIAGGKLGGFTEADRLRLLQDAAAKGWPQAMSSLARLLRQGKLLPADPKRAEELERAVEALQPGVDPSLVTYYWDFG